MPAILRIGAYRFYFYSHEPNEPPHIHIDRDNLTAKFWLRSVSLAQNIGFPAKELRKLQSMVIEHQTQLLEAWYEYFGDERVKNVSFTEDTISVDLMDGRTIVVPLVWYPRLLNGTSEQLAKWEVCGGGYGIHWEDLDEDLSTEGMLRGAPAPRKSKAIG
jgi:hypothetical protein